MTIYLTLEDVLEIHRQVIAETGGSTGIRDVDLLDSAIHRSQNKSQAWDCVQGECNGE